MNLRKHQRLAFPSAIICLLAVTILLCLPGNEIPQISWLDNIQFDKIVHLGLFSSLTLSWCWALAGNILNVATLKKIFARIAIIALLYGTSMEFVQHYLIPFRSFDYGDIAADAAGAAIGYWLSTKLLIKK